MAGGSLLALLDDIATVLDDVAILSKMAMKKSAGVLGDDLALNAEQVSGVKADRELPVVWAVAKGSLVNKVILVPAALAISAFIPVAVIPLMMLGGLYLCFEGFEKIAHRFLHPKSEIEAERQALLTAVVDPQIDMVAFEKAKIRGAIRTDFVLSAEIIVITLGTVAAASFVVQLAVLSGIALLMTVGVYGLVAGIVKLDDLGLYLSTLPGERPTRALKRRIGSLILRAAPYLMKTLSIAGTAAMFLVGGGILVHGLPALHHGIEHLLQPLDDAGGFGHAMALLGGFGLEALVGIVAGGIAVILFTGIRRLRRRSPQVQA